MTKESTSDTLIGKRVRFISLEPDREPIGTVIQVRAGVAFIKWDDEHPITPLPECRWRAIEVV